MASRTVRLPWAMIDMITPDRITPQPPPSVERQLTDNEKDDERDDTAGVDLPICRGRHLP